MNLDNFKVISETPQVNQVVPYRWVAPFYILTDVVLDGIISKLQYSLFCMKRAMNRISACAITLILGKK